MIPVKLISVAYEPEEGRLVKVGRLAAKDREILFEYEPSFLGAGLSLSPFKLPSRAGVVTSANLMGVFEDSLPDGWGRLLMDRRAAKLGIPAVALGPLDRLALVGARSMGALVYQPEVELETPSVVRLREIEADVDEVLRDVKRPDLDRLIALGGSPQGARPKVLIQLADDGSAWFGDRRHRAGCTSYLVKFRARADEKHSGALELAYMRMATRAGIDVPETKMLGRTSKHPGYFAIRRFDRQGARKLHLHTFGGLIEAPHGYAAGSYRDLLILTRDLTRDESAVKEMFRRACFNVFAHNRDDHVRNFAFLMDEHGRWRPSPAYDLTFSGGPGGEHSLLVGREGANPGKADLLELAASVDLKRPKPIIDEVRAAVARFSRHADEARVPKRLASLVAAQLR